MDNPDKIINLTKFYFDFKKYEISEDSITFDINCNGDERNFSEYIDQLNLIGYTAFTDYYDGCKLIVIKYSKHGGHSIIKIIMGIITISTIIYSGFIYDLSYSGGTPVKSLLGGIFFFAVPLMIIILFREFGRYIAFKRSGMHYSFPIMVPSLGIGTLGFINTSRDQYKTGKSMLFSGFLSILFGFISSIIIIILGFFYEPSVLIYHNIDYMPVNRLDLPLMSTFFLNKIIPAASLKPPMEFAGYSGLISTALNALPLGFLDGGLVSSAISGKNQIYLSIVSIIILLTLSFIFPFILILLIISVIIGIRGPAPLNNLIKIPKKAMITAATIVTSILIFTMVPAGIQVNHNGGITVNMPSYVIVNKNWHENATLKVSIVNHGAGRITPQFYIDNLSMVVNNGPMYINPGGSGTYNISIMTYNTNLSGYKDYKMLIYTGMQTYNGTLKVYYIKSTPTMVSGNYSNTSSGTVVIGAMVGSNITLKISNNLNYTMNLQAVSISNGMDIFKLTNSHIWENITASSNIFGNGIMLPPDHSINITFRALTPGTWIILFYSNNTSTLVIINVHAVHKRFTFSFFLLFHQQIQNILQAQYAHDLQGPWGAYSQ